MKVSVYDDPQVRRQALPTVRQNANDYNVGARQLEGAARAIGDVGDVAAAHAARLQDQTDADTLFRTETALVADYQENFEAPARESRRGHKAIGVAKDAGAWLDKAGAKYAEGLTTERQRRLFANKLMSLRQNSVGAWSTFEGEQRRASLRESTKAGIVADINLAAANPGNKEILDASRESIRKRTTVLGDLEGQDEQVRAVELSGALTQLHSEVLTGLLDKNPTAAKAYFEANKAEIDGSKHAEIEARLKSGSLRAVAQAAADELAVGDEAAAIAKARKKYSGDEEEAVVAEIKTRFNERDQARAASERNLADDAWKRYADGGYQRSAIPNSVWTRLDGKTRIAIDADYAQRLSGADVKTNWDTYDRLRTMARETPELFAKEDLRKHYPALGKSEREALLDLQDKYSKGEDVATLEQQLATAYKQMDWGSDKREERGALDVAVRRAIREEQKANGGKPLNDEAREKIIDRMLLSGSWSRTRFYEVAGTDEAADFEPEIPKAERRKIEEALTRAGKPITDAEVMRLFKRKHGLP